jgi:3-dehydroquinate synthase
VSDRLEIESYKGIYSAEFIDRGIAQLNANPPEHAHIIIDRNVAEIYADDLSSLLASRPVLIIEATEENKSLDKCQGYIEHLVAGQIRREQPLLAIGGGIIQDITCFLATTMMRGLPWFLYPTTLLAQADSCIGSKSSINVGKLKNLLGTFTPPNKVIIDTRFLDSLRPEEILSGVGEMLKVHAINGPESFDDIAAHYSEIFTDRAVMKKYIFRSLEMKKKLIEIDEFDKGPRNAMNFGHSFGHAIESATNFGVPHGVAVSIGMDMANFIAAELGVSNRSHFDRMHGVIAKNYEPYKHTPIPMSILFEALAKDKKNTATQLKLILPDQDGKIQIGLYDNDDNFKAVCKGFFSEILGVS